MGFPSRTKAFDLLRSTKNLAAGARASNAELRLMLDDRDSFADEQSLG
jgi:hypothetical protein